MVQPEEILVADFIAVEIVDPVTQPGVRQLLDFHIKMVLMEELQMMPIPLVDLVEVAVVMVTAIFLAEAVVVGMAVDAKSNTPLDMEVAVVVLTIMELIRSILVEQIMTLQEVEPWVE